MPLLNHGSPFSPPQAAVLRTLQSLAAFSEIDSATVARIAAESGLPPGNVSGLCRSNKRLVSEGYLLSCKVPETEGLSFYLTEKGQSVSVTEEPASDRPRYVRRIKPVEDQEDKYAALAERLGISPIQVWAVGFFEKVSAVEREIKQSGSDRRKLAEGLSALRDCIEQGQGLL